MKATGVVRRIDELGRIVIPKEIRRTLKIKEGTPLEIFSGDNGELYFKKYSPVVELGKIAIDVAESIQKTTEKNVIITNMEKVIAYFGKNKENYIEKNIDSKIEKLINARKSQVVQMSDENSMLFYLAENIKIYSVSPIMANGDVFGSIIIFDENNNISDTEKTIGACFAEYLSKQIG